MRSMEKEEETRRKRESGTEENTKVRKTTLCFFIM